MVRAFGPGSALRYNLGLARASARSDYFGMRARPGALTIPWRLATVLLPRHSRRHLFVGRMNTALKRDDEIATALERLRRLGLVPHEGREKNWDAFRAYSFAAAHGHPRTAVLDMGSAIYGVILPWLHLQGWRDLHGCDLSFTRAFRRGAIEYSPQNIERTSYPASRFDFVTCLSVIEHGVDLAAFFREASRVLKPGGHLLLSTDYWREPLSTPIRFDPRYNCPVKVFSEGDIRGLLRTADEFGFQPTEAVDTACEDKVVYWERLDLRYTFLFLALRRT